ncbi:hypothetical protein SD81_016105 [Tolypothrix campylonemoides VB511288]|nr:hypothetical protein SD81_016105 [Tolypothrix campylonemoides VB511288]
MHALRTVLLMLAALLGALACAPAAADPHVSLQVVDRDTGAWLQEYRHRGQRWIAGEPGHRYALRLTNRTGGRVLVVVSIDGVNAVTGETAHPSQAGYVLEPWQSTEVAGWRKSVDDVAQFVFTDLPDSYAARTGRPDDVGVIGIAVFEERAYAHVAPAAPPVAGAAEARRQSRAQAESAAAAADGAYDAQRLGTGHGAREWSPVSRTSFERATRGPAQVTQLRYDDLDRLLAMGVVPSPWRPRRGDAPEAFPGAFVPDPPYGR